MKIARTLTYVLHDYLLEPLKVIVRNGKARIGLAILLIYIGLAIVGPHFLPPATKVLLGNPTEDWLPPSLEHPFGTDNMGRDIFSMLVLGTPYILTVSFLRGLIIVFIGMTIGIAAGYLGGKVDSILTFVTDVVMNIPAVPFYLVLAMSLLNVIDVTNPFVMAFILSIIGWAALARAVRSQVLVLKTAPFVEASKALGMGSAYILFREIAPNIASYVAINFVYSAMDAIYIVIGLYFVGLPLPETVQVQCNWGYILNQLYKHGVLLIPSRAYAVMGPLLMISGLQIGLILFSYGLEEVFNPRLRVESVPTS